MNAPAITPWTGLTAADYHSRLAREDASKPKRFRCMTEEEAARLRNEELAEEQRSAASSYYAGNQAGRC